MTNDPQSKDVDELYGRVAEILSAARRQTARAVNSAMTSAYWLIGREIVDEEQRGKRRAEYGARLIKALSARLTKELGDGFGERQLRHIRQFYLAYADRDPVALEDDGAVTMSPVALEDEGAVTMSPKMLDSKEKIWNTACSKSQTPLFASLSWSHYRELSKVSNPIAREFYEIECERSRWSVRELRRRIRSFLFERLARSRDRDGVLALARRGHVIATPADLIVLHSSTLLLLPALVTVTRLCWRLHALRLLVDLQTELRAANQLLSSRLKSAWLHCSLVTIWTTSPVQLASTREVGKQLAAGVRAP